MKGCEYLKVLYFLSYIGFIISIVLLIFGCFVYFGSKEKEGKQDITKVGYYTIIAGVILAFISGGMIAIKILYFIMEKFDGITT